MSFVSSAGAKSGVDIVDNLDFNFILDSQSGKLNLENVKISNHELINLGKEVVSERRVQVLCQLFVGLDFAVG